MILADENINRHIIDVIEKTGIEVHSKVRIRDLRN